MVVVDGSSTPLAAAVARPARSECWALHAAFIGRFLDLRSFSPHPVCLDPDPSIGYPEGQALARKLVSESSRGLIYPSVRIPGGVCLVAFQPNVAQDLSPGACWKITWDGTPSWTSMRQTKLLASAKS